MDGRKDERDQTALADLDRYIHITWRQFRPAAICAQPPRKLPRASLLLQVAKTRMELEGCEGQADSRQQWGAKGKGLLQHPVCFLSNRSGHQASPRPATTACSAALTGHCPLARHVSVARSTSNFSANEQSICSEKQICCSQNSETASWNADVHKARIFFSPPCIFPAGQRRSN